MDRFLVCQWGAGRFCSLPTSFCLKNIKQFSEDCASYRNSISHYGSIKKESFSSSDYVRLNRISAAISNLYHILLLKNIGINDNLLTWIFHQGTQSVMIKATLAEVGLLDQNGIFSKLHKEF